MTVFKVSITWKSTLDSSQAFLEEYGEPDCFVYGYVNGNKKKGEVVIGQVYFYKGVDASFFEDPKNRVAGFNEDSDLMIGDFTNRSNPTLYAFQAQKVKKDNRKEIIDVMFEYQEDHPSGWRRTKQSVLVEWRNHHLYSLKKQAQDVDFDNAEEGKGTWYYFKKAVKAFFR